MDAQADPPVPHEPSEDAAVERPADPALDSVFSDDWADDHRSGIVAVIGRPNAGKSTLINRLLGQKIAAVSPKPQTTRRRQLGIYTEDRGQILFTDTPGMHRPQHKLGEFMMQVAENALKDADVILLLYDVSDAPQPGDRLIADTVTTLRGTTPILLALNKIDTLAALRHDVRAARLEAFRALIPHEQSFEMSALQGVGVGAIIDAVFDRLPVGPRYYPADQLSEVNMRTIAAEVIREKAMLHTEQEVPHAIAVEIDSYQEREDVTFISGSLFVERDSQKGIVVGKGGAVIRQIGTEAREDLEDMLGAQVYLDLRVKVLPNWRSDDRQMGRFGYRLPKDKE